MVGLWLADSGSPYASIELVNVTCAIWTSFVGFREEGNVSSCFANPLEILVSLLERPLIFSLSLRFSFKVDSFPSTFCKDSLWFNLLLSQVRRLTWKGTFPDKHHNNPKGMALWVIGCKLWRTGSNSNRSYWVISLQLSITRHKVSCI